MAPEEASIEDIEPLRVRIDEIDRKLVELLNARSGLANRIGHIKKILGLAIYDPSREKDVLTYVVRASKGPLPDPAIRRLFERIIDETRSLERQRYQDPPEE
ncbi:MAG: chorismate mutase [Bacteroidota bacterium]|nr:chorismate mutase [Bacteroidota bacterium]MDE2835249.1 chorismate mutase [Bacteroidota bacterium]MDE2957529.1 chorismate mutase [Bacteroidota bacterium]